MEHLKSTELYIMYGATEQASARLTYLRPDR